MEDCATGGNLENYAHLSMTVKLVNFVNFTATLATADLIGEYIFF